MEDGLRYFHEIGHVINGDLGITFEGKVHHAEDEADTFAENKLIPADAYQQFLRECNHRFTLQGILRFARFIDRDPGIVLGRLQNDGKIEYGDRRFASLQKRYKVCGRILKK